MRKIKNFFSIILVICIFATFTLIPAAESTTTTTTLTSTEKAEVLNKLSILKGDISGDYKLDNQLKRSEAATFIIRLLGKEAFVLENNDNYINTTYTDVTSSDWFAPYVGYCSEEGIIAGMGNNLYNPNAYISEKAFLKLVLVALGYEYGNDFSWSEVYNKAYEVNLVTDPEYLERTADNNAFTREGVVGVIYNALSQQRNSTAITLIQSLINEGAVTPELAASVGLAGKVVNISVTGSEALNETTLLINFDKAIKNIPDTNIKIYETGDITKQLTAKVLNLQNNILIITTSKQTAYTSYTIEISGVSAQDSLLSNSVSSSFLGYKAAIVNSDFFRINRAEAVSKTSVNIYFTHPVNVNSEYASFYEITDANGEVFASGSTNTLAASFAVTPNNVVTLSLVGKTFTSGLQYTVRVSGDLTSVYTVKLNEGVMDMVKFTAVDTDTGVFSVTGTSVTDNKTLQLTFNKEVHATRAQQVYSYYITDNSGNPVKISKAVVSGTGTSKNRQVYLSIDSTFLAGKTYTVLINEIEDVSRQYSIIEKSFTFSGTTVAATALSISSVTALDKGTLKVLFNKNLDETTAIVNNYYLIAGISLTGYMIQPQAIYYDAENAPNAVRLYLPLSSPLTAGNTYKLTALGAIKDYMGYTSGINMEAILTGSGSDSVKPTISDAVVISNDTIKVTFSKEISVSTPNILASNYTLQYDDNGTIKTKIPLIAGYINNTTIVLKFDRLDLSEAYTLIFNSLKDYSGLYTRTSADGGNTFNVRIGK